MKKKTAKVYGSNTCAMSTRQKLTFCVKRFCMSVKFSKEIEYLPIVYNELCSCNIFNVQHVSYMNYMSID